MLMVGTLRFAHPTSLSLLAMTAKISLTAFWREQLWWARFAYIYFLLRIVMRGLWRGDDGFDGERRFHGAVSVAFP
jgi:hypothetical protein